MKSVLALSVFALGVFAQSDSASSNTASSSAPAAWNSTLTASSVFPSSSGSSQSWHSGNQTTSGAAATQTAAPSSYVIPAGVSATCGAYLTALDSDPTFAQCTTPLLTATNAFAPSSGVNINTGVLVATLNTLCASPGCSDAYIRKQLVNFNAACKAELTGSNIAVKDTYDIIYVMNPLKEAICSKDSGTYCVLKNPVGTPATTNSTNAGVANAAVDGGSDASLIQTAVANVQHNGIQPVGGTVSRRAQTVVQYAPDTQVYRDNGVMYLYTLPTLTAQSLCTNCTKSILTAYGSWEASVNYAAGLSNSPMLGNQADLWSQVQAKCGASFISAVQASMTGPNSAQPNVNAGIPTVGAGLGSGLAAMIVALAGVMVAL